MNYLADRFPRRHASGERRHATVTDRHTAVDYARILKDLSDVRFPTEEIDAWEKERNRRRKD